MRPRKKLDFSRRGLRTGRAPVEGVKDERPLGDTMTLTTANTADFDFDNNCLNVPCHAILASGRIVSDIDWKVISDDSSEPHKRVARARLTAAGITNPGDWVLAAVRSEDLSYYDEYEGKWEFYYETHYIVIPRSVVDEWEVDFRYEDAAAAAGFAEYMA